VLPGVPAGQGIQFVAETEIVNSLLHPD